MDGTISFWLSKIIWAVVAPSHLLVLFFILSLFSFFPVWIRKILRWFSALALFVATLFPVGEWALVPLEQCMAERNPPMQVDGVIVLGGALDAAITEARKTPSFTGAAERIIAMMALMKTYPNAQFIFTGGTGSLKYQDFREADYVKRFFNDHGVNVGHAIFETESRNTLENMEKTKDVFAKTKGQTWLIVTSAYHMPRAMALFEKGGAESNTHFIPSMVDFKTSGSFKFEFTVDMPTNLALLDLASKEYLGLVYSKMRNHTSSIWPCKASKAATLQ